MKYGITFSILFIINTFSLLLIFPNYINGESEFKYDESKSIVENILDNCASSPSWMMPFKSLFQISPSKEKCDEVMVNLYQFCYKSVGFVEGLANAFGRNIEPGSVAANVKVKCSDERITSYQYPESFQDVIDKRDLNEMLNDK